MSHTSIPSVFIAPKDYGQFLIDVHSSMLQRGLQWDWENFSCNLYREVWPTPGHGYTRPSDRVHLEGKFPFLDYIVYLVLARWPEGKRFRVKATDVMLADGDVPICHLDLVWSEH